MDETSNAEPVAAQVDRAVMRRAGEQLAQLGGRIYSLADDAPDIQESDDFNKIMFYLNKLSYRLIHGKERDA